MVKQHRHLRQIWPGSDHTRTRSGPDLVLPHLWCKTLELIDPVGQSGKRGHYQKGAHHCFLYHHGNVSDALDSLSQSHLIRQDPVDAVLPQHLQEEQNKKHRRQISAKRSRPVGGPLRLLQRDSTTWLASAEWAPSLSMLSVWTKPQAVQFTSETEPVQSRANPHFIPYWTITWNRLCLFLHTTVFQPPRLPFLGIFCLSYIFIEIKASLKIQINVFPCYIWIIFTFPEL